MSAGARRAALRMLTTAAAARSVQRGLTATVVTSRLGERSNTINYRGHPVSRAGGPSLIAAAGAGLAVGVAERRVRDAALIAGGVAAFAGALDDVAGSGAARGLRGHFDALRRGEVTTGALKAVAIGLAGLAAGWRLADGGPARRLAAATVVAGSANAANLLDLRPGRALKAAVVVCAPLALGRGVGADVAAAATGAALGCLRDDLRERTMLGDAGANCLGALIGVALVAGASRSRVAVSLGTTLGLTALSERISFSRVIDAVAPLRWLDRLGRLAESADA